MVFLSAAQNLPAARLLPAGTGRGTLRSDLLRLELSLDAENFDFDRIKPLLKTTISRDSDDAHIWDQVYSAVVDKTPPPQPIASSFQQTPWLRNTSSFANSSEHRKYMDDVLKEELGPMYVGLHDFHDTYFGEVADLEPASKAFLEQCMTGSNPRYANGWRGWPRNANQNDVLSWFADFCDELAAFAVSYNKPVSTCQRRPLAKPNEPIHGSTAKRKIDISFVSDPRARKDSRYYWSQILIPGELRSNPSADKASEAWLDLGRYARAVLAAQDTRRFVLGFTICGSLMRVWEFDRLGGIASEQFNINEDGLRFVSTILGFLWMNEEQLGFDPTIISSGGKRYIEVIRYGRTERLILEELIKRARCIAGRATTCWKAYREGDLRTPLIIKDSWQYTEREEEGELLREATDRDVVHMARYYFHYTVRVGNRDDDIRDNVRGVLNIMKAENYRPGRSTVSSSRPAAGTRRNGRNTSGVSRKRSSSYTDALPPSKRSCSTSPTKESSTALPNRIHRRIILRDFGRPIYMASSRTALLSALEGCIEGHRSLRTAGFLHRDISINNLMINEDKDNPSWPSFLIDLDLAIKERREGVSGAKGKTGTRAFMAIGALLGEQHSFMHDLESFFWVLFWICIHYDGPGKDIGSTEFESWNYEADNKLVRSKKGVIDDEEDFLQIVEEGFTAYYRPLIPWVNRLRRKVFPNGERWKRASLDLYHSMKEILREAQKDPMVAGI